MNLRSLDLNLLIILDALLDEAHVSRAAVRLRLSQPAASAALDRCRHIFCDRLLERGRGTMRLTPKALALRAPLRSILADVTALLDPQEVPLAELRQRLTISMADYPALFVLNPLQQALQRSAPGIDIVVQPWRGGEAAREALVAGRADLAISVFPGTDGELHRETLLEEHYVAAMRPGHPAAAEFDLEAWLAFPHIMVSGSGEPRGPVDDALAERGLARRLGLVVPTFQMVPELLLGSDMIALLPSRCVPPATGLAVFPPPLSVAGFALHLAWHKRRETDRGLRHVAGILSGLLA